MFSYKQSIHLPFALLLVFASFMTPQEEKYLDNTQHPDYSVHTTLFTTLDRVKNGKDTYQPVAQELSISNLHRFSFVQQQRNLIQSLGNNGTAIKPLYYPLPKRIGFTSGFYAYDDYFNKLSQHLYYDTRSPYARMNVVLARYGSYFADLCYSRHVTPHWNVGAAFQNMMTDKEWFSQKAAGDRQVTSYGWKVFTSYKSPNGCYQLLADGLYMKHNVRETGGIYIKDRSWSMSQLLEAYTNNRLDSRVRSGEKRKQLHLYQQIQLSPKLTPYHELHWSHTHHLFKAKRSQKNDALLMPLSQGRYIGNTGTVQDKVKLKEWSQELGIKCTAKRAFYRSYYRHRRLQGQYPNQQEVRVPTEHYLGWYTKHALTENDTQSLRTDGELLLFTKQYKTAVHYQNPWIHLSGQAMQHSPSYLTQQYHSHFRRWCNSFKPIKAYQLRGEKRFKYKAWRFRPGCTWTRIDKLVYCQQVQKGKVASQPRQAQQPIYLLSFDIANRIPLPGHLYLDNEIVIATTLGPGANLLRVPRYLCNTKLYYAKKSKDERAAVEAGMDLHWKAACQADGYDPAIQQFYLQQDFTSFAYPTLSLFFNARIKHVASFIKIGQLNELLPWPGCCATPYYPDQRMSLDIGVNWLFFD